MKRSIVLLITLVITSLVAQSQPYLFGTNQSGNGKIIRYDVAGNKLEMVSTFENDGLHLKEFSPLTRIASGIFYGVTNSGGRFGNGVLFKLDSSSGEYTIVHDFGNDPAMIPADQPVFAKDGKLYGVGYLRNEFYTTLIYSYNPANGVFEVEKNFDGLGLYSRDRLVDGPDGKLYGTFSTAPGNYDTSRVFSFDPISKSFELYFNPDEKEHGTYSIWKLTNGHDGKLYGTATSINFVWGGILAFDPVTKKVDTLQRVPNDGEGEKALEVTEYKGKLYGTTENGGLNGSGTMFSYDIQLRKYDTILSFPPDPDYPSHNYGTRLVIDDQGIIHGMNYSGLFSFDPVAHNYSSSSMTHDPLTGHVTFVINDTGVLALKSGTSVYNLVKRLNSPKGLTPGFDLYKGISGMVYGATTKGGLKDWGGLFSFDPTTSKLEMLYDFKGYMFSPGGPIVEMENGDLYFLNEYSEQPFVADGSLIRYSRSDNNLQRVHDFNSSGLKADPKSLVKGEQGNLYGIAYDATGLNKVLYRFSTIDGSFEKLTNRSLFTTELIKGKDDILYTFSQWYTGTQWAAGLVAYNVHQQQTVLYPYKFGTNFNWPPNRMVGLGLDSNSNVIFSFPNLARFNVTTHEYSQVSQNVVWQPGIFPLLISKDSVYYFSNVSELEEHQPWDIGNIQSVNEQDLTHRVLTDLPGDFYFKASVLYSQPIITRYSAITIVDTTVNESDQQAVLRIHLSKPLDYTLRLYFRTRTGTATPYKPNRDFIRGKGMIYVKKGTVDKYIRITVLQDQLKEPDEKFYMQVLKTPHTVDSIQIVREQATITIMDGTTVLTSVARPLDKSPKYVAVMNPASKMDFGVIASPNPSSFSFRIQVTGTSTPMNMRIVNVLGVTIERFDALTVGKGFSIGSNWVPGVYFAIIQQGNQTRTVKLIKRALW